MEKMVKIKNSQMYGETKNLNIENIFKFIDVFGTMKFQFRFFFFI